MWKVKLVGALLSLFIIGTVIFLVLDPGGDIYNQYLSLGGSSKSGFESKKEFNYQAEIKASKEENSNSNKGNREDLNNYFVPSDLTDKSALLTYINGLPVCYERKQMLTEGVNILGNAVYQLDSESHNNWNKETFNKIECSGFTAWCYNRIGITFKGSQSWSAPSTDGYADSADMKIISNEEAIPGDIGHIYKTERVGVSAGHVGIYFGKTETGQRIYMDAGGGAGKPVPRVKSNSDLDKRTFKILAMEDLDNKYYAGSGNNNGSSTSMLPSSGIITWDDSWEWSSNSKTHSVMPKVYKATSNRKDIVVALNPGHGSGQILSTKVNSYPDIDTLDKFANLEGKQSSQYANGGTPWLQPGHTAGASLVDGTTESEWCLQVCESTRDELLNMGYDVIMLRHDRSNGLDNPGRAIIANQYADIHVSIHFNSSDNASIRGMGAYFAGPVGFKYYNNIVNDSKKLSDLVLNEIQTISGAPKNDGFAEGSYSAPRYSRIPFTYIECGFGSNNNDSDWLKSNTTEIGKKVAIGINKYFN